MQPPKTPDINDYLSPEMSVIEPDKQSKFGYNVPEIIFTYGNKYTGLRKMLGILPTMLRTKRNMEKGYRSLADNSLAGRKKADCSFFSELTEYVRSLGILDVGFTTVPRRYIFSNKKILFNKAIVLTMEMNKQRMYEAPAMTAAKEVWRTYYDLGQVSNNLAEFLRKRGYAAQAGPALGGETNYPLLAQKAGLGRIGKHGLLITPSSGPSLRIAAVYTNIENFPSTDSRAEEHRWVDDFCKSCLRCVTKCPGNAIFPENLIDESGGNQAIDYKKCARPFSLTVGCSICIKECTFFKGDYKKIKESTAH